MLVASNTTEDNVVLLSSLEGINAGNLDFLVQVLLEGAVELHVVDDIRPLAFVGGDDADLPRDDSGFEELRNDLLDVRGFGSVGRALIIGVYVNICIIYLFRKDVPLDEISSWPRF